MTDTLEHEDALRIEKLGHIFVEHRQTYAVTQELEWLHTGPKKSWGGTLTLLMGDSGSGKTTIVHRYTERYPPSLSEHGTTRPVLYVRLPRPCSIKTMASAILNELGDPYAERSNRTTNLLTSRIVTQLRGQGVGLLIIDEFQHLIDPDRDRVQKEAADWIKVLLDEAKIPVVCVGMPKSVNILAANTQLNRRTAKRIALRPFKWDDPDDALAFRGFLYLLDDALPFETKSGLAEPDIAEKICRSCGGLAGLTAYLVREAGCLAILDKADHIHPSHLATALDQLTISETNWFGDLDKCSTNMEPAQVQGNRRRRKKGRITDVLR